MTPRQILADSWRAAKARFRTLSIAGLIVILSALIPDLKFWFDALRPTVQPMITFLGTGLGRISLILSGLALIYFDHRFARKQLHAGANDAPPIEIIAPVNGSEVGLRRFVIGFIQSPNSQVQVLVLAENLWHLQRGRAVINGFFWKLDCQFGNPKSGLGKDFKIIAIANGKISGGPFLSLPTTGVPSEVINVRRRH